MHAVLLPWTMFCCTRREPPRQPCTMPLQPATAPADGPARRRHVQVPASSQPSSPREWRHNSAGPASMPGTSVETGRNVVSDEAPKMAVRTIGSGPDVVLFHGGMGCWQHWIRNVDALAERFTVHALDHPSYGASASVPRETTGAEYLELFDRLFSDRFPGDEPLRFAGFSFGGAIAAHLARRLGPRVTDLCLVSPAGFTTRKFGERPTRSYREAGGDDARFREICRHNLLINMLSDPASVTEET